MIDKLKILWFDWIYKNPLLDEYGINDGQDIVLVMLLTSWHGYW